MARISIDKDKCKGCLLCISFCPKHLISVDRDFNKRGIQPAKVSRQPQKIEGGIPPEGGKDIPECLGCSLCAIICPDCCIEVYK